MSPRLNVHERVRLPGGDSVDVTPRRFAELIALGYVTESGWLTFTGAQWLASIVDEVRS
jgi:hypothetical protein